MAQAGSVAIGAPGAGSSTLGGRVLEAVRWVARAWIRGWQLHAAALREAEGVR